MKVDDKFNNILVRKITPLILPIMSLLIVGAIIFSINGIIKRGSAINLDPTTFNYDINRRIPITGITKYHNINSSEKELITAAKDELLVYVNPETSKLFGMIDLSPTLPESTLSDLAEEYNFEVLRRSTQDFPIYRVRLRPSNINVNTRKINLFDTKVRAQSSILPNINTNTPESSDLLQDGSNLGSITRYVNLEERWERLQKDSRTKIVGLNYMSEIDAEQDVSDGYWTDDEYMNPPVGDKEEHYNSETYKAWKLLKDKDEPISGGDANIWIADLDTGVDLDHPDLEDNIIIEYGRDFLGCDPDKFDCTNVEHGQEPPGDGIDNNDNDYIDEQLGHGTGTSGVISGSGDNEIGVAGTAYNTKIVPLRICKNYWNGEFSQDNGQNDHAWCPLEAILDSVNYSANIPQVKIINMSLGANWPKDDPGVELQRLVINYAWENKKVIVAAAMNDDREDGENGVYSYPSSHKNVISVAALSHDGTKADFSNYGTTVDISGYGEDILMPIHNPEFDYVFWSGTSFSSPQVAGAVALLWSYRPELTNKQVFDIITQTGDPIKKDTGILGPQPLMGGGSVNPYQAIVSEAPLLDSPKHGDEYNYEGIEFKWYPYPGKTIPTKYWIDVYLGDNPDSSIRPSFVPEDGSGIDMGHNTSRNVSAKILDKLDSNKLSGMWRWRVAAQYGTGETSNKIWSASHIFIKRSAAAELIQPVSQGSDKEWVRPGDKFIWEEVDGAKNYVIKAEYTKPHSVEEVIFYINTKSTATERVLTQEIFDVIPAGTNKLYWQVNATTFTNDVEYGKKIFFSKNNEHHARFYVPKTHLWETNMSYGYPSDVKVTILNHTESTHTIKFAHDPLGVFPYDPPVPGGTIASGDVWEYTFKDNGEGEYRYYCTIHDNESGSIIIKD